jgi:hypothetical protein
MSLLVPQSRPPASCYRGKAERRPEPGLQPVASRGFHCGGAGSAGSVLVRRLIDAGKTAAAAEAGGASDTRGGSGLLDVVKEYPRNPVQGDILEAAQEVGVNLNEDYN